MSGQRVQPKGGRTTCKEQIKELEWFAVKLLKLSAGLLVSGTVLTELAQARAAQSDKHMAHTAPEF